MILVVFLALAIKAPGECRNRIECSKLEERKYGYLEFAKIVDRERDVCLAMSGKIPYDKMDRLEFLNHHDFRTKTGFADWAEEAAWHESRAKLLRNASNWCRDEIQKRRERMIIPWTPSRRLPK